MAERRCRRSKTIVGFALSRGEIAEAIDLRAETVSRVMSALSKCGKIQFGKEHMIFTSDAFEF